MRIVRAGFELGVSLRGHEPGMVFYFHHLYKAVIGERAGNNQTFVREFLTILVIELITMTMTFSNIGRTISSERMRTFTQRAGIRTKTHRAALVLDTLLGFHQVDNRVLSLSIKFGAVCVRHAADVTGKFDNGTLHA